MPPDRWKIFVPIPDKSDFQLKEPPPDLPRYSEGASPLIHQISWKYLLPDDLVRSEEELVCPVLIPYYQLRTFSLPGVHSSEETSVPILISSFRLVEGTASGSPVILLRSKPLISSDQMDMFA